MRSQMEFVLLKDRLRTSAILIAILLGLLLLDYNAASTRFVGVALLPLLLFFALGTAWDMATLLKNGGKTICRPTALVATAITTLSGCVPMLWPLTGYEYPPNCPVGRLGWIVVGGIVANFITLIVEMVRYRADETPTIERTSAVVFVSMYVGLPMALLVAMRSLGDGNWGLAAIVTMIAVTKSTDAGAYFTGKSIGKHKLIPRLSPGKTREGAVGGIVTAIIVAFVCLQWILPWLAGAGTAPSTSPSIAAFAHPVWGAMVLGSLLALAGMVGDLAESLVKRSCGAKDSGGWLPGLGGVWDVTDSLIAAILPAYLCFAAGVGGNV